MLLGCTIVDDDTRRARKNRDLLELAEKLDYVTVIERLDDALDHIRANPHPGIFWVDMNLGENEFEGMDILKLIKQLSPESLVIVYTVYKNVALYRSVDLANLYYFEKDTTSLEDTLAKIDQLIMDYKKATVNALYTHSVSYPALVSHIDRGKDGMVKLICYYQGQEIERLFKLGPIEAALKENLSLNNWLTVTVLEGGPDVTIQFKKTDAPGEFDFSMTDPTISDKNFLSSRLWDPNK
jgi:ActR/RegA family two-component response regulator